MARALHAATWPFAWSARVAESLIGSVAPFEFAATLLSLLPGHIGQYVRASFYMQTVSACHADLVVGFLSVVKTPRARFGRHVYIGALSILGETEIDDDAMIGSRVTIEGTEQPIRIGRGAWIGEGAIVMAHVGDGCIVGAGTLVDRPVPAETTVVGNPFRVLCR